MPFPDLSDKQRGHNWYILIPKWHLQAFCNAATPALLEASDDINFSLFPEVCRKLRRRKRCGKKLKLHGKKKRKIDRKPGFNRTACTKYRCPLFCISTHVEGKMALSPPAAPRWALALPTRGRYSLETVCWGLCTGV